MADYLIFEPKTEYDVISSEGLGAQQIALNLLRGDKLVMVDDKQDLRDYFFTGNKLKETLSMLALNKIIEGGVKNSYVVDFLWKLSTLKHEYSGEEMAKYLYGICDNFVVGQTLSEFPGVKEEIKQINTTKGEGTFTLTKPQSLLIIRALFYQVTGIVWNLEWVPKVIHDAAITSLYSTAKYVLNILGKYNEEGDSIIEICTNFFNTEYAIISFAISNNTKDAIAKKYEMTGTRPLSYIETYQVIADYIDREFFDYPKGEREDWTNEALAKKYNLPRDYRREDILYVLEHGAAPQPMPNPALMQGTIFGSGELTPASSYSSSSEQGPNWVFGPHECVNSNTSYLNQGPRSSFITKGDGVWFSYGYQGDRVCYSLEELISSYDKERGIIRVPDHEKIVSASQLQKTGIRSTLFGVFTPDQIKPLVAVIRQNLSKIHPSSKPTAEALIEVISEIHDRFRTVDELKAAYKTLNQNEREMFKAWLRLIMDTYKAIDTNNKEIKAKYYGQIDEIQSKFTPNLSAFVEKLSLINDRGELVLKCPQGGLRSVIRVGMENKVCDHTVFMLGFKTAAKIIEYIK